MPRKSKAILGVIVAAIALVALMAVPAFADTVTVNLNAAPAAAAYGHEVIITPSITGTTTVAGDALSLEAWSSVDATWEPFGEGLKIEDTQTVNPGFDPQYLAIDEYFLPWYVLNTWQPIQVRGTYKPASRSKDASGNPVASPSVMSNTTSFSVIRIKKTGVANAFPKRVKRNAKIWLHSAVVTPALGVGVGTMRYVITGPSKTQVINGQTDETGAAVVVAKFPKRGTYKVSTTFWGNAFGAKSKTVTTKITVR